MNIAIIIPAKNEEVALPELLESIVSQSTLPSEVIVVDSHSTDRTVARAKTFAKKLPLRLVTARAKGVAAARNAGAASSKADFFLFIDSDVTLPPDFIATTMRQIKDRSLDHGGFIQKMPSNQLGLRLGAKMMNNYVRLMSRTPWPICFSCFFMKRSLFEKIGGFDPKIFVMEDYDIALRGKRGGGRFGVIKHTIFYASPRRYEANDGLRSIFHGIYAEGYRYTHGMRITKPLFTYKMGGGEKEAKK